MPTPDNRQDLSAVLRKTADFYDDDPGVETMLRVAADEIAHLTTALADRTHERDDARTAARTLYRDVLEYDPNDHCPGWCERWPWLGETTP